MAVNVYYSTDASAPVLNNTAGSLITVLDACLVNGYGSKSAAGWVKSYSSGSIGASYRQGTGSNQFYVNIDDSQPNYARARGYEVMTAYDTGTGAFPTTAQVAGTGSYFQKTNNTAGDRPWVCVANEKIFYFFTAMDTSATHGGNSTWFCFGDIISTMTGDAYETILVGAVGTSMSTDASNASTTSYVPYYCFINVNFSGHYMPRSYTQVGTSIAVGKHIDFARLGNTTNAAWLNTYAFTVGAGASRIVNPNSPDGGLYVSPVWVHEGSATVVRGRFPGLWLFQGNPWLTHKDTYTGSGELAGKTFVVVNSWNSQFHIETSDTWY